MIIIVGLLIGVILALCINVNIPDAYTIYVAVGILAALDSVFGGVAAVLRKDFDMKIFLSGFSSNILLSAALAYIGKILGISLYMAAIIVFGARLFQNFAIIRRFLLIKLEKRDIIIGSENLD